MLKLYLYIYIYVVSPREIGSHCWIDTDCSRAVNNTECSIVNNTSICICDLGYATSSTNDECIPLVIGHEGCTADDQCSAAVPNSNCTDSTCYCNSGYYPSVDNSKCSPRHIGDDCILNTDCAHSVGGSYCNSRGRCECDVTGIVNNADDVCVGIHLGDDCNASANCGLIIDSSCRENGDGINVCLCNTGYISTSHTECRPPIIGEDTCITKSDCTTISNSHCKNETCLCNDGYIVNEEGTECNQSK